MAIALNDILQITDVSVMDSSEILNVYFYRTTARDVDTDYPDVSSCFQSDVQNALLQLQSGACVHTAIHIRNLTNGIDVYDEVTNNGGVVGGENFPNFVSLGFRLVRTNATTRHGSKRIGGLPETLIAGNSVVGAFNAAVAAAAAALAADITFPGTGTDEYTGEPVIIGRWPINTPNAGQLNLSVVNPVATAALIRVTSQTSRRKGRGR